MPANVFVPFFIFLNQFNHWCWHVPSTWKIGLSSIPERGENAMARLRSIARLQPLRAASIMRLEDNSGDKECYETFLYFFLIWARLPHSTRSAVVRNGRISCSTRKFSSYHWQIWGLAGGRGSSLSSCIPSFAKFVQETGSYPPLVSFLVGSSIYANDCVEGDSSERTFEQNGVVMGGSTGEAFWRCEGETLLKKCTWKLRTW